MPVENHDAKSAAPVSSSSDYEEKTEIIYGEENVIKWVLRKLPALTESIYLCGDRHGPSILLLNEKIWREHIDMHDRGVKQKLITEITEENIVHCKKVMQYLDVRHLDGLVGYFSVMDGRLVSSTAYGEENKILPHLVISTVRVFVEQHRYFFETLWNKAIPAKKRIREIEEGARREFVEIIRDPSEILRIGYDLIRNTEEEILILFSTPNALFMQQKAGGALELLNEVATLSSSRRNIKIRILIAASDNNSNTEGMTAVAIMTNERIRQLKELGIDIREITKERQETFLHNNSLTLIIADQSSYLTVELNDDKIGPSGEEEEEDAIELATYSNSEATVFAHISIFENLWTQKKI